MSTRHVKPVMSETYSIAAAADWTFVRDDDDPMLIRTPIRIGTYLVAIADDREYRGMCFAEWDGATWSESGVYAWAKVEPPPVN